MVGGAVAAFARIVAIVLVGAGIAGLVALVEARPVALVIGVVAIAAGGLFIGASNQASWVPFVQRPSDSTYQAEERRALFGSSYGIAAVVGLLGAGLVVGALIETTTVLIGVGVGGLVALVLLRQPASDEPH